MADKLDQSASKSARSGAPQADALVWQAFDRFFDRITPWLFDTGLWIFGGLIAFSLLVLASLITVGPVSLIVVIATVCFALALPLNVTGLVLLRWMRAINDNKVALFSLVRRT